MLNAQCLASMSLCSAITAREAAHFLIVMRSWATVLFWLVRKPRLAHGPISVYQSPCATLFVDLAVVFYFHY